MTTLNYNSGNNIIVPSENNTTYRGLEGDDTYIISKATIKDSKINIVDTKGNNKIQIVDLYEILFGLNPSTSFSQILKDDAIVIVPPIGETIALDGDLPSPGIYEINKNETIKQFLEFSTQAPLQVQ